MLNKVKHGIAYLTSSAISKGLPLLILPFITNILSPQEFGIWAIFQSLMAFALPLIFFSLSTKINKEFFTKTKAETAISIANSIMISAFLATLTLIVLGIISLYRDTLFALEIYYLFLLPIIAFFSLVTLQHLSILRNLDKAIEFGLLEVSRAATNIIFIILFLFCLELGWVSLVFAWAIAYSLIGMFSFWRLYQTGYFIFRPTSTAISNYLLFSYPIVPHALSGVIISTSDRLLIDNYIDKNSVAFYTIGYTFSMVLLLFSDAFNKVWNPWFYKNMTTPHGTLKIKVVQYSYLYILCLLVLGVLTVIFASLGIDYFLPSIYQESKSVVTLIVVALLFNGIATLFFPYFIIKNKTKIIGLITVFCAIINLVLNILLIPIYGIEGAALATLITFSIKMVLMIYISSTHYKMPWFSRQILIG